MQSAKPKRTEQGLTMLECLVAMAVIITIVVSITPPLLVSYATRIQNYKIQNAMRIAQGELDRVRMLVENGEYTTDWTKQLPPFPPGELAGGDDFELNISPPDTNYNAQPCPLRDVTAQTQRTAWCTVDINGDGNWDLGVQTFRTTVPTQVYKIAQQPIAFVMGVRVYTRAALKSGNVLYPPGRKTASGLTSGESLSWPLITRYETIVRSDLDISRFAYCELSKNLTGGTQSNCPQN